MEEEKKAIEQVKMRLEPNKYGGLCALGYKLSYCFGKKDIQALETILNLIEKQDKMIDYMAEIIEKENDICDEISTDECSLECKECIKEIVRKKVEEDAKN